MNRNVTAVILIVLAIGVYLEFTEKVWNDTQAIISVNSTYQKAIGDAQKVIDKLGQLSKDYSGLSANDQDRLGKILPTGVDSIRLIIDLNSIALRRGFTLHGITVSAPQKTLTQSAPPPAASPTPSAQSGMAVVNIPPAPTSAIGMVTVSFSTSAPYQQFIQFMRDLEADLHVLDVSHLSLKAHDNGIYDYTVEFKTYWLEQQ